MKNFKTKEKILDEVEDLVDTLKKSQIPGEDTQETSQLCKSVLSALDEIRDNKDTMSKQEMIR